MYSNPSENAAAVIGWRREQRDGPDEIDKPNTWDAEGEKKRFRENSAGDEIDEGVSACANSRSFSR